jgi:ribonuclease T2
LQFELNLYWPNFKRGGNDYFWEYEWYKHGSCSAEDYDLHSYFELGLIIFQHKKAHIVLKRLGYEVDLYKKNDRENLAHDIRVETGGRPQLICRRGDYYEELQEIRFCIDKNDLINNQKITYIDCVGGHGCGDSIYWLP